MSAVKRRKQKLGAGDRAFNIVLGGLTTVSVVVILYPLIFVLVASISDPMEIFQGNVWLWPKGFNLEAYKQVFRNGDIFTGYKNTLIYTVVGTLVTIIITFSAAYPLSRKKLYGRSKLMGFFLFTMFFSGGMIPTYLMVKNLGLYNTMWAVILVGTVSVYNIIVARTFMQNTIPEGYPLAGRPRRPAVLWVHSSQDICGRSAERHEQQQNSARRICAAPGGRGRPALL